MWKIWCKALGQKEGKSNREADAVAVIRTCILIGYMVTNCFIVSERTMRRGVCQPTGRQKIVEMFTNAHKHFEISYIVL